MSNFIIIYEMIILSLSLNVIDSYEISTRKLKFSGLFSMAWESCIVLLNSDSTGSFYTGDIVTGSAILEFKKVQKIDRNNISPKLQVHQWIYFYVHYDKCYLSILQVLSSKL